MIERLGRFPDRNRVLRRPYTQAEADYAGVSLDELNRELEVASPPLVRQNTLGRVRLFGSQASQQSAKK